MTVPERATTFAVEGGMHGFVRTDRGPLEAPHRTSTAWIHGYQHYYIGFAGIKMQPEQVDPAVMRIDEARGCRITNIAPWTHTSVSHGVRCMIKQPWQTGWTNVFENGTSDASARRNAEAATNTDVMEMTVSV